MKKLTEKLDKLNEVVNDDELAEIVVTYRDDENDLEELLNYIKSNGNGGHSFEIVVDPDMKENKKTFYWDGDGICFIKDVKKTRNQK